MEMKDGKMNDVEVNAGGMPVSKLASVDVQTGVLEAIGAEKLDEAELFLRENNHTWDQVEELLSNKEKFAALVKKVDWKLMPLLMVTYGLQLIDKTTLSYSAVFGLETETHLIGQQYSWVSSIFYFGMALF